MFVFIVASKSSEETSRSDARTRLLSRGVVYDDVEAAKAFACTGDKLLAELLVAQIAGDAEANTAFRFD
jgi:hypothetical protein